MDLRKVSHQTGRVAAEQAPGRRSDSGAVTPSSPAAPGGRSAPAEPFSHSRSLAGQEAELWPGDEQDDAQYEWELREEILGWRP